MLIKVFRDNEAILRIEAKQLILPTYLYFFAYEFSYVSIFLKKLHPTRSIVFGFALFVSPHTKST